MKLAKLQLFLKENRLISFLILVSLASSLRALFLPLFGDENTYSKIAQNIIFHGEYAFNGRPSTITPSIPFILALFYTKVSPALGYALAKLLNLGFIFVGLKYIFAILKKAGLKSEILWSVLLLTVVNNNFVIWSLALYPEAILFCFFWMFLFYLNEPLKKPADVIPLVISFAILLLTRYLYAVFGVLLVIKLLPYFREIIRNKKYLDARKLATIFLLVFLPLLFWFKYVYYLEKEVDIGLSYFNRFKNNGLWYNISAGLGLIGHQEVGNINGIPAFISLFVPMTGLRNWFFSILLILSFCTGYISKLNSKVYFRIFFAILLVMIGLVFAGTGFSRYWLIMLPGFLLGFYFLFHALRLQDTLFVLLTKIVAVVYVLNEIRLDIKIFNDYF